MPSRAAALALEAVEQLRGCVLPTGPVVSITHPDWDDTVADFSDPEITVFTQLDEHDVTHTIVIPREMMIKLRPHFLQWLTANQP